MFVGDVNNDGQNDIVTANQEDDTVSLLHWNQQSGDWEARVTVAVGIGTWKVFIGDANNDGQNDIVTAIKSYYRKRVLRKSISEKTPLKIIF